MEVDLTSAVGHPFYHNPVHSDLDIARRITEDYSIEHFTLTARFVKRMIRLDAAIATPIQADYGRVAQRSYVKRQQWQLLFEPTMGVLQ
jgi:hypothetical protein